MSKTLDIDLGGQQRKLLFGVNGFFFYIKEATNTDPFEWLKKFDQIREQVQEGNKVNYAYIEDVIIILFAGLNSHLDITDQPNIPFEKVQKWANGLEFEVLTNVFTTSMLAFAKGEAVAPPKNGATLESKEPGMTSDQRPMES